MLQRYASSTFRFLFSFDAKAVRTVLIAARAQLRLEYTPQRHLSVRLLDFATFFLRKSSRNILSPSPQRSSNNSCCYSGRVHVEGSVIWWTRGNTDTHVSLLLTLAPPLPDPSSRIFATTDPSQPTKWVHQKARRGRRFHMTRRILWP